MRAQRNTVSCIKNIMNAKVLFWVPYPAEGASNRYRVGQYLPYLKKAGIDFALHPFWSCRAYRILYRPGLFLHKLFYFILGTFSRIKDVLIIKKYDIVFIHRESYPVGGAFFEKILSLLNKQFMFDFDDAIFLPAISQSNAFIEGFKRPEKIAGIVRMSSHVIAGNNYLADFAGRHNPAVSVIPTVLDTDTYYPLAKKQNGRVVIGWIGSATTLSFLDMMRGVFDALLRKYSNITIKIVGGEFFMNEFKHVISKPWSMEEELADLRSFTIGIMPMPDNYWTMGKCGFKAISYMSMGIPSVCSAVGVNKEIISDGLNGFLASDAAEWINKLSLLISDSGLREAMGIAARRTIEDKYSLKVGVPRFLEIVKKVYAEEGERH